MRKTLSYLTVALLMLAGPASAEIVVIQAEDAVDLGTNWVVVADTNVPPIAFGGSYLTQQVTRTDATAGDEAYWSVGNLTSNATYDVYMRLHVGPGGFNDDSIFPATGFNVSNSFAFVNGLAGVAGLDGSLLTADGFHWAKVVSAINSGAGTNLVYYATPREDGLDFDALAMVSAGLPVTSEMLDPTNSGVAIWPAGHQPDAPTVDSTPEIQALFVDAAETVNTNSITMTLDGASVIGFSTSYSNFTTTVSYTPGTALEAGTTHTAKVVIASNPSGVFATNEWTFFVETYPIVYVDASETNTIMAASTNGPVGAGTALITSPDSLMDGLWRFRNGFGVVPSETNGPSGVITLSATNTLFESHDYQTTDNVPRLKTSVSGLSSNTYAVYVYFWNASAQWCVRAGLEDTSGTNSLTYYDATASNVLHVATDDSGTRTLHRAFLGYVTGTSIDVYIEDLPGVGSNDRVWYDGIGYQLTDGPTGPTMDPDIQSVSIAGGTATLTWASETVGTYSILHKTNLTDAVWTPVKTGIAGGDPTTTDSVSVSGDGQEFFSIEGN